MLFKKVYVNLDMQSQAKIQNIPDATSNGDAVSKLFMETYVAGEINTLNATAFKYKGALDASTNPNYPAAVVGDVYKISVAGKIGGASGVTVEVGDTFICTEGNAGGTQASVGSKFNVIQSNLDVAAMAGSGLGNSGNVLNVNVDDSTIELSSDALRVKDAGITETKIADGAVTSAKVGAGAITAAKLANNAKLYTHAFEDTDFTGGTTLTVAKTTHGLGDTVAVVAVLDSSGNVTDCDVTVNDSNGSVTVSVLSGLAFDGKVIIAPRA